jgi:hypothetical protein
MVLVDPARLQAIESVSAAASQMRERKACLYISGEPIVQHSIATSLPAGDNSWDAPNEFRSIPEFLVLVQGSAGGVRPDFFNTVYLNLWSMRPAARTIVVTPQKWFNEGDYDFGYQRVTRIARLANGELVGEGIRLGPFLLDETGTQIKQWLHDNPFRTEWNAA